MKYIFIVGCAALTLNGEKTRILEQESAVDHLLSGGSFSAIHPIVDKAAASMKANAVSLPDEVAGLLALKGKKGKILDEKSITKARKILNDMMETAQKELDEKVMECKEEERKITDVLKQVTTDINNAKSEITNLEEVKTESSNEKDKKETELSDLKEEIQGEKKIYTEIRRKDEEAMTWKKNDLRVAEFLLRLTKCKDEVAFLSMPKVIHHCTHNSLGKQQHTARFADEKAHMAMLSMHESGRRIVEEALLASTQEQPDGEALAGSPPDGEMLKEKPQSTATEGTSKPASARKQAKKCSVGKPNCALLHDNMSLMWGRMKDAVDKLDHKMTTEQKEWEFKTSNWNQEIDILTEAISAHAAKLAEATSQQTSAFEFQTRKEQEERELTKELTTLQKRCKSQIYEILYTKFCGYLNARGELHKESDEVKPDDILDCEVEEWVEQECSVPCDDAGVGGTLKLTREITQMNNEHGVKCPSLSWEIKCGRKPCEVDCEQSEWGGYSDCTAECGGGVQSKTRTIITKPRNGGTKCELNTETISCNSFSCNRDCSLTDWVYRPCSVACGGGWEVRRKHETRPKRGEGKCPKKKSRMRYQKRRCNQHACRGDEECVAKQDLIIAIDGSGSVREKGFEVLRNFTAEIAHHYRPEVMEYAQNWDGYWEMQTNPAAKVGVIQFGNGALEDGPEEGGDPIVSKALLQQPLENDPEGAATVIDGLTWQRGFTNMAQVFTLAKNTFLNGGRPHAQSVVLVITDGLPSFRFQTRAAVKKLRRTGVKVVMVAVKEFLDPKLKTYIEKLASLPRATNFIHIPGLKALKEHQEEFVNEVLIHTCPKTVSQRKEAEDQAAMEREKSMGELTNLEDGTGEEVAETVQ